MELFNKNEVVLPTPFSSRAQRSQASIVGGAVQTHGEANYAGGVHECAPTHLTMIPVAPLVTVIKTFIPGRLSRDYQQVAATSGMRWKEELRDSPGRERTEALDPDYPSQRVFKAATELALSHYHFATFAQLRLCHFVKVWWLTRSTFGS